MREPQAQLTPHFRKIALKMADSLSEHQLNKKLLGIQADADQAQKEIDELTIELQKATSEEAKGELQAQISELGEVIKVHDQDFTTVYSAVIYRRAKGTKENRLHKARSDAGVSPGSEPPKPKGTWDEFSMRAKGFLDPDPNIADKGIMEQVFHLLVKRLTPSTLREMRDIMSIVQPTPHSWGVFEKQPSEGLVGGEFAPFPTLQRMYQLFDELGYYTGKKGLELSFGAERIAELEAKPSSTYRPVIMPLLIDEYKRRYNVDDPKEIVNFFLNEPAAFFGDFAAIASAFGLGVAGAGKVAGSIAKMSKLQKMTKMKGVALNFSKHATKINDRLNKSRPLIPGIAHVPQNRILDIKGMPLADMFDPAMIVLNLQTGLIRKGVGGSRAILSSLMDPNKFKVDQELRDLYKKHGIIPPPAALLGADGKAYSSYLNYSLTKGNKHAHDTVYNYVHDLNRIAEKTGKQLSEVKGGRELGTIVIQAYTDLQNKKYDELDDLWNRFGKPGTTVPVDFTLLRNAYKRTRGHFDKIGGMDGNAHEFLTKMWADLEPNLIDSSLADSPVSGGPVSGGSGKASSSPTARSADDKIETGTPDTPIKEESLSEQEAAHLRMLIGEGVNDTGMEFKRGSIGDWLRKYYAPMGDDMSLDVIESGHRKIVEGYGAAGEGSQGMHQGLMRRVVEGEELDVASMEYLSEAVKDLRQQMPELGFVPDHVLLAANAIAELKYPQAIFTGGHGRTDSGFSFNNKLKSNHIMEFYRRLGEDRSVSATKLEHGRGLDAIDADVIGESEVRGAGDSRRQQSGKGMVDLDRQTERGVGEQAFSSEAFNIKAADQMDKHIQDLNNKISTAEQNGDFDRAMELKERLSEVQEQEQPSIASNFRRDPLIETFGHGFPSLRRNTGETPIANHFRNRIDSGLPVESGTLGKMTEKMQRRTAKSKQFPLGGEGVGVRRLIEETGDKNIEKAVGQELDFANLDTEDLDVFREMFPHYKDQTDENMVLSLQFEKRQAGGSLGRHESNISPFPETTRYLLGRASDYTQGTIGKMQESLPTPHLRDPKMGVYTWYNMMLNDMPRMGTQKFSAMYDKVQSKFGFGERGRTLDPAGNDMSSFIQAVRGQNRKYQNDPRDMPDTPDKSPDATLGSTEAAAPKEAEGFSAGVTQAETGSKVGVGSVMTDPSFGNPYAKAVHYLESPDTWDHMTPQMFVKLDPMAQDHFARIYGGYRGEQAFTNLLPESNGFKLYYDRMKDRMDGLSDAYYDRMSRSDMVFEDENGVEFTALDKKLARDAMESTEGNEFTESGSGVLPKPTPEQQEFARTSHQTSLAFIEGGITREAFDALDPSLQESVWRGYTRTDDETKAKYWAQYDAKQQGSGLEARTDADATTVDDASPIPKGEGLAGSDALEGMPKEQQDAYWKSSSDLEARIESRIGTGEDPATIKADIDKAHKDGTIDGATHEALATQLRRQSQGDKEIYAPDGEETKSIREQRERVEGKQMTAVEAAQTEGATRLSELEGMIEEFVTTGKTSKKVKAEGSTYSVATMEPQTTSGEVAGNTVHQQLGETVGTDVIDIDIDDALELDSTLRNLYAEGHIAPEKFDRLLYRLHGIGDRDIVYIPAGHLDDPSKLVGQHGILGLHKDKDGKQYFTAEVDFETVRGYSEGTKEGIYGATGTDPSTWTTNRGVDFTNDTFGGTPDPAADRRFAQESLVDAYNKGTIDQATFDDRYRKLGADPESVPKVQGGTNKFDPRAPSNPIYDTLVWNLVIDEFDRVKKNRVAYAKLYNTEALKRSIGDDDAIRDAMDKKWFDVAEWTDDQVWDFSVQDGMSRGMPSFNNLNDYGISDEGRTIAREFYENNKDKKWTSEETRERFLNSEEFQSSFDGFISRRRTQRQEDVAMITDNMPSGGPVSGGSGVGSSSMAGSGGGKVETGKPEHVGGAPEGSMTRPITTDENAPAGEIRFALKRIFGDIIGEDKIDRLVNSRKYGELSKLLTKHQNYVEDLTAGGSISMAAADELRKLTNLTNKGNRPFMRIELSPPDDAIVSGDMTVAQFREANGRDPNLTDFENIKGLEGVREAFGQLDATRTRLLEKAAEQGAERNIEMMHGDTQFYFTADGWGTVGPSILKAARSAGLKPVVKSRQRIMFAQYADNNQVILDNDASRHWRDEEAAGDVLTPGESTSDPKGAEMTPEQKLARKGTGKTEEFLDETRNPETIDEVPVEEVPGVAGVKGATRIADDVKGADEINEAADAASEADAAPKGAGSGGKPIDDPSKDQYSLENLRVYLVELRNYMKEGTGMNAKDREWLDTAIQALHGTIEEAMRRASPRGDAIIKHILQDDSEFRQKLLHKAGSMLVESVGLINERRGHKLLDRDVDDARLDPEVGIESKPDKRVPGTEDPEYAIWAVYNGILGGNRVFGVEQILAGLELLDGPQSEGSQAWRAGVFEYALKEARTGELDLMAGGNKESRARLERQLLDKKISQEQFDSKLSDLTAQGKIKNEVGFNTKHLTNFVDKFGVDRMIAFFDGIDPNAKVVDKVTGELTANPIFKRNPDNDIINLDAAPNTQAIVELSKMLNAYGDLAVKRYGSLDGWILDILGSGSPNRVWMMRLAGMLAVGGGGGLAAQGGSFVKYGVGMMAMGGLLLGSHKGVSKFMNSDMGNSWANGHFDNDAFARLAELMPEMFSSGYFRRLARFATPDFNREYENAEAWKQYQAGFKE